MKRLIVILVTLLLVSCAKEPLPQPVKPTSRNVDIYLLTTVTLSNTNIVTVPLTYAIVRYKYNDADGNPVYSSDRTDDEGKITITISTEYTHFHFVYLYRGYDFEYDIYTYIPNEEIAELHTPFNPSDAINKWDIECNNHSYILCVYYHNGFKDAELYSSLSGYKTGVLEYIVQFFYHFIFEW